MCGMPMSHARLFDAVFNEGIVKICEECSIKEKVPIIRKPTTFQLKEAERKQTFYEKLSGFSGIKPREENFQRRVEDEVSLREIVERNFKEKVPEGLGNRPELKTNFHWIIMRARRMKKLTQQQLARELQESETAIKMAEQGRLPEDDYKLVNKLEIFLGIKIIREEFAEEINPKEKPEYLSFDMQENRELTIEDIKAMRKREEALAEEEIEKEEPSEEIDVIEEDFEDIEENLENKELSREEMDKIIFGR